ncbi:hypothetical protein Hanom_Chr01g00048831 [Helianthus anomalus]
MLSSESSELSNVHDPMAIVSDNEIAPAPEVFSSDSETDPELMSDDDDPDDFQPFALHEFGDDLPYDVDVLAFPLPIHDQLIIGHPDGEHLVEPIPIDVVDHLDENLGDDEVYDIAILDIPSPVVYVVDISSDSDPDSVAVSFESMTSSALLAAGVRAYPTDDDDDALSVALPLLFAFLHLHIHMITYSFLFPHPSIHFQLHHPAHKLHLLLLSLLSQGVHFHHLLLMHTGLTYPPSFLMRYPLHVLGCTSGQPPNFDPLAPVDFMSTPHFSPFETNPYF